VLLAVTTVKLIAEVALFALLGQWMLGLLGGSACEHGLCYQVLRIVGKPFIALARVLSGGCVRTTPLPWVAFCLLAAIWLWATILKVKICLQIGLVQCG